MAKSVSVPSLEIRGRMCYRSGWLESLQRSAGYAHSGEVYAYHCLGCGNSWKIYQNSCHGADCPHVKRVPFDPELAQRLIKERKKAVRAYWRNFNKKLRKKRCPSCDVALNRNFGCPKCKMKFERPLRLAKQA